MLTPVSGDYATLSNYDGRKAMNIDLTCRCLLSNIRADSIFHESTGQGITCFVLLLCFFIVVAVCFLFFYRVLHLFSSEWNQLYHYNTNEKIVSCNRLRQIGLISIP